MQIALVIIVSVAVFLGLLFFGLKTFFGSIRRRLDERVAERFGSQDLVRSTTSANFFGVESLGGKQVRGMGALVLTEQELWFYRAVPAGEYVIPVGDITGTSTPKSFAGKSKMIPLLCVHYQVEGRDEKIAWAVPELEQWLAEIGARAQ